MYVATLSSVNYTAIVEKRSQEIQETMLKARDAKYSIPVRYGKVMLCGAAASGKTNFLNLLMKEDFQPLHISTEVLKPQQVAIPTKVTVLISDGEVEFKRMSIDDEVLQLESYLPQEYDTTPIAPPQKPSLQVPIKDEHFADNTKLALANVKTGTKKLCNQPAGAVWDILTFMDTSGQPQFVNMLPAINNSAMITFILHKMEPSGQSSLNRIVEVQYGNDKGEVSYRPHPQNYTYLQIIETLISYAGFILLPDTKFLDNLKIESRNYFITKSIVLAGTHSGNEQLADHDIREVDDELTKVVCRLRIDYIKPLLNKNYQFLVPVDNKKQGNNSKLQVRNTKRYTSPSDIRRYILRFLNCQDIIHVPVKWLLLELEIRKVCQQRNCNIISYDDVLKLAKERKLGYNGEFGDDVDIDGEQFIKQGLRFHHSFGVLLYFEDVEGMQKFVITNHQWLFNKLSKIIQYSFTCTTVDEMEDLRDGIFNTAMFDSGCLDINKDFKDSQISIKSVDPINAFLKLLEHLLIAAPLNENAKKYFMPCILASCELTNLEVIIPDYKANDIEPLLIQFKSTDNENKNYSFPRGLFCFLVVELIISMKWKLYSQAYVNLITIFKADTANYVTLIDRIFCLEVHVAYYKKDNNIHDEVRKIINKALHIVAIKFKFDCNLCYGFTCSCQLIKDMHISYIREDNCKYCICHKNSVTDLTDSYTVWLKSYFMVSM